MIETQIPLADAECCLVEYFLGLKKAQELFDVFMEKVQWSQPELVLFGKKTISPRLAAWYADQGVSYTYSGMTNHPLDWFDELIELKQQVSDYTHLNFIYLII